ncbi:hypothetical protein B0G69_5830 [Paraburkholderia sp. RAU2J]|nr:hypothetical protein B0G69_5830 [Paraburkholderia sp. RAU2J]
MHRPVGEEPGRSGFIRRSIGWTKKDPVSSAAPAIRPLATIIRRMACQVGNGPRTAEYPVSIIAFGPAHLE